VGPVGGDVNISIDKCTEVVEYSTDATFDNTIGLGAIRDGEVGGDIKDGTKGGENVGGEVGGVVTAEVVRKTIATKNSEEGIGSGDGSVVK
jgi:hypothetical protein